MLLMYKRLPTLFHNRFLSSFLISISIGLPLVLEVVKRKWAESSEIQTPILTNLIAFDRLRDDIKGCFFNSLAMRALSFYKARAIQTHREHRKAAI